jgi:hypothetical protein
VARMERGFVGEGGMEVRRGEEIDCVRVEMEGRVLIRDFLQLPPTTAPRGATMVSALTVTPTAPAVRFTSGTGFTKHTDFK